MLINLYDPALLNINKIDYACPEWDGSVGNDKQVGNRDMQHHTYDPAHRLPNIADNTDNRIGEQVQDPSGALASLVSRVVDALKTHHGSSAMSGCFIVKQPGIKSLVGAVLFTLAYSPLYAAVAQTQNTTTKNENFLRR